jgi:fatty acid-binding protein DegV
MPEVAIVTDTTACIPKELVQRYGIAFYSGDP